MAAHDWGNAATTPSDQASAVLAGERYFVMAAKCKTCGLGAWKWRRRAMLATGSAELPSEPGYEETWRSGDALEGEPPALPSEIDPDSCP